MFLGIEIGGTKLQLGLGHGDGHIHALWRGTVDPAAGGDGIRRQIQAAIPELLAKANADRSALRGVGIGFGGPVDDATRTVIKSHQITGWDGFPLADWVGELVGVPAVLGNDADVAGLAEALFGAGKGLSPIFYMTIGSGIGGGLIINGEIYRGAGKGAAEIGHLVVQDSLPPNSPGRATLEAVCSGWGIETHAREAISLGIVARGQGGDTSLSRLLPEDMTAKRIGEIAKRGDVTAKLILGKAWDSLAEAICQMIVVLCPRRVVIGGGVSLMGEELLFQPLRQRVSERVFPPFAGLTDIVPAALGEEVVVHGALALARKKLGG